MAAALFVAAQEVKAEVFWLAEPGYCQRAWESIEDDGVMMLGGHGISTHWLSCEWPDETAQAILEGLSHVSTQATCMNATESWQADMEIVTLENGDLRVFQENGGLSPVYFYRC